MIAPARRPNRKPIPDNCSGFFPQRQDAPASSLASDMDGIEVRVPEIADHDGNQLGDPEAGGISQVEHGAVPSAGSSCWIGGVEQRTDFLTLEVGYDHHVMALHGHGMPLLRQIEAGRHAVFEVPEERLDRRESHIAGADRVLPLCLKMIEVVHEFAWMPYQALPLQETDKLQRAGHEATRTRPKHLAPLRLHPRTAAIMVAEPTQHTMINFADWDAMPLQPEQEMAGFQPKRRYPTVRQAAGPQVVDEWTEVILE